jgi:hypothetical protein
VLAVTLPVLSVNTHGEAEVAEDTVRLTVEAAGTDANVVLMLKVGLLPMVDVELATPPAVLMGVDGVLRASPMLKVLVAGDRTVYG